jgi:hypothetical protein
MKFLKKIVTGAIIQIELREGWGFAYAKYVDFFSIIQGHFHANCLEVYDYITQEPSNNLEILKEKDLLFGPRIINGKPSLRGQDKVSMIGLINDESEIIIPDFKDVRFFPWIVEDESRISPWYPIFQLHPTNHPREYPYKLVKHLEHRVLTGKEQIRLRIEMEILRKQGKDPKEIVNLDVESQKFIYFQMINVPIYSTIPREMRGKALPLNYKEDCSKEVIDFVDGYGLD